MSAGSAGREAGMRMMPAPGAGRPRGRAAVLRLLLAAALVVAVQGSCDAPPRIPSAELKESYQHIRTFSSSDRVEYTCRPGYAKKKVRAILVCDEDGRWTGSTDFCSPKQCSYPGDPANGRLVEVEQFTFGSIANYSCDMGYRLIGNSQIHCVLKNGQVTWDGEVPFCEPIPCSPPPNIENGEHNGGDTAIFSYGSSVTYRCHSAGRGERAFSMVGDPSIFCTTVDNLNGVWNKPAPECKGSCDDPPDVFRAVKARLAGNLFPADTVVTYECETGYEFSPGENTRHITCLPDLTWTEVPHPCNKIRCPDPVVRNAMHVNEWYKTGRYMYGDSVKIVCNEGYTVKDYGSNVALRCTSKGTWEPAVTECTAEPHCPQPVIDHGQEVYKSKNDYSAGTRVRMVCDEGYALRGDEQIECKDDQNWAPSVPFCDKVCDPPPQITSGQHTGSRSGVFPYGSEVTYSCAAGLSLVGDESIYCTSTDGVNLVWSGPAPECSVVRCPRPAVEHGTMSPSRHTFPYGVTLKFSCDEGFVLHGDAETQCMADGTWQPPLPSCVPVQCSLPAREVDVVFHAVKKMFEVNDILYSSCERDGYRLKNAPSICSADGTWIPPPKCKTLHTCQKILQIREAFVCGIPLTELKTLLEVQKLYLEIQKLEEDLRIRRRS